MVEVNRNAAHLKACLIPIVSRVGPESLAWCRDEGYRYRCVRLSESSSRDVDEWSNQKEEEVEKHMASCSLLGSAAAAAARSLGPHDQTLSAWTW